MRRVSTIWMGIAILTAGLVAGLATTAAAQQQQPASAAPDTASQYSQVFTRYCITCHNERLRTAEMVLTEGDIENPSATGAIWEKVIAKLRARSMPPMGMPRPDGR